MEERQAQKNNHTVSKTASRKLNALDNRHTKIPNFLIAYLYLQADSSERNDGTSEASDLFAYLNFLNEVL